MATTKKQAEPAKEVKETAVNAAAPAAPKAEEKKPAAKKPAAKKPAAEKKPAAKKAAEKKPAAKKPAAKKAADTKAAAKKPAAKKTAAKGLTFDTVVDKARKKVLAAKTTRIKFPIAANVILSGSCEGIFYIYIDEENIAVEPYQYNDYNVKVTVNDAEAFVKVLDGKLNVYDALATGAMSIEGITKKAILLVDAVF